MVWWSKTERRSTGTDGGTGTAASTVKAEASTDPAQKDQILRGEETFRCSPPLARLKIRDHVGRLIEPGEAVPSREFF